MNTFLYIWLAGLVLFAANCYILFEVINNYSSVPYAGKNLRLLERKHEVIDNIVDKGSDTKNELISSVPNNTVSRKTRSQTKQRNKVKK